MTRFFDQIRLLVWKNFLLQVSRRDCYRSLSARFAYSVPLPQPTAFLLLTTSYLTPVGLPTPCTTAHHLATLAAAQTGDGGGNCAAHFIFPAAGLRSHTDKGWRAALGVVLLNGHLPHRLHAPLYGAKF